MKNLSLPLKMSLLIALIMVSGTSYATGKSSCATWLNSLATDDTSVDQVKSHIFNLAEKTMREAGKKVLEIRSSKDFNTQQKRNFADLKTKGDCASQSIILNQLGQDPFAKNANFIAEEQCSDTMSFTEHKKSSTTATWVLDPIDGTTNYAHGMPHFSISLALVAGEEVCFGAVYGPTYRELFFAWQGDGAFLKTSFKGKPEPIHVSAVDTLNSSLWITGSAGGPAPIALEKNKKTFHLALNLLPQTHDLRRTGSAALDLAFVAAGRVEGYFELTDIHWWDIAAGVLLVKEAGGNFAVQEYASAKSSNLSLFERPIYYVLATNGKPEIHDGFKSLIDQEAPEKK